MSMFASALLVASAVAGVLALLGCVQAAAGALAFARYRRSVTRARWVAGGMAAGPGRADGPFADVLLPPASVLKPLHGDEPLLEEALLGFITQDYPCAQIVFGVQRSTDPAVEVVRRLCRRFPDRDLCLVIDSTQHGPNRKIGNLINMLPHARHDLLVISDSDIHVAPDYLRQVALTFARDERVGLVTTLYQGIPASPSLSRRFAADQINHSFLPGVLMSRLLGRQDCLGSTMALRRETLDRIGGLPMLLPHVADDSVLGSLVRDLGLHIAIAPTLTATTVAEGGPAALYAHELRWGRTVRAVEPLGYAASAVQFPLFWAAVAAAASGLAPWSLLLLGVTWAVRAGAAASIDRLTRGIGRQGRPSPALPVLLLPLRDFLSAVVMAGSFSGNRVNWRGQMLRVSARRSIAADGLPAHAISAAGDLALAHAHPPLAQGD